MEYHFKIRNNDSYYWAECIELPGCNTQGKSKEELFRNMHTVLNLFLDEPADSTVLFDLPQKIKIDDSIVEISVEPKIAFSFILRRLRLQHKMTQKQVAEKLGYKNLYSYQRLESSKSANPALITISKIKKIFPEFPIDIVFHQYSKKNSQHNN